MPRGANPLSHNGAEQHFGGSNLIANFHKHEENGELKRAAAGGNPHTVADNPWQLHHTRTKFWQTDSAFPLLGNWMREMMIPGMLHVILLWSHASKVGTIHRAKLRLKSKSQTLQRYTNHKNPKINPKLCMSNKQDMVFVFTESQIWALPNISFYIGWTLHTPKRTYLTFWGNWRFLFTPHLRGLHPICNEYKALNCFSFWTRKKWVLIHAKRRCRQISQGFPNTTQKVNVTVYNWMY